MKQIIHMIFGGESVNGVTYSPSKKTKLFISFERLIEITPNLIQSLSVAKTATGSRAHTMTHW